VEPAVERPQLYVVSRGERAEAQALVLARQLRQAGRAVELDLSGAAFGKQLRRADRSGADWAVLIGESEVEQQELILKALQPGEGTEERLPLTELLRRFA
jgi:histidyl-tRNA synthetase